MKRSRFRFEDLEVWREARDLAVAPHRLARTLDEQKRDQYAEQLRAAALSGQNCIAEVYCPPTGTPAA